MTQHPSNETPEPGFVMANLRVALAGVMVVGTLSQPRAKGEPPASEPDEG